MWSLQLIQGHSPLWTRRLRDCGMNWVAADSKGIRDAASNAASEGWLIGSMTRRIVSEWNALQVDIWSWQSKPPQFGTQYIWRDPQPAQTFTKGGDYERWQKEPHCRRVSKCCSVGSFGRIVNGWSLSTRSGSIAMSIDKEDKNAKETSWRNCGTDSALNALLVGGGRVQSRQLLDGPVTGTITGKQHITTVHGGLLRLWFWAYEVASKVFYPWLG